MYLAQGALALMHGCRSMRFIFEKAIFSHIKLIFSPSVPNRQKAGAKMI